MLAASSAGNEKIVRLLLDHGAEVDIGAIRATSYGGHEKVAQLLQM